MATPVERKTVIDKAWDTQAKIEARVGHLGRGKYGRVLKMARKPTPEEFRKAALVTSIGILFLGVMGFAIANIMDLLR